MLGKTISHYKVLEKIGQGGMGEVYRAEDTNLSREVAIKVLPEQFTQDPQRLARFEREAKLLAQLNHPNIAAIYGLEEAEGVRFLALELVPGETLQERVAKGPLPVEEALEICRQIAEGVEAAHEKGVIHRDLKPANVKVTPEGKVKILDFGLAKAFEAEPPATDFSQSPTLTEEMTRAGVILGTAAYMSPEQARGKPIDTRADIFAFGCVLYELLTGKRAFEGETVTDTIASILKSEPDWQALPDHLTWNIRTLLRRCLKKEPHERLQHIGDTRIEVEETLTEPSLIGAAGTVTSHGLAPQSRAPLILLGLLALVLGALLSGVGVWSLTSRSSPPVKRFVTSLNSFSLAYVQQPVIALSPDGTSLAYVGQTEGGGRQLYLKALAMLEGEPISGTEGASNPFFSPDGEWIGFFASGKLKKVSVRGGTPMVLCDVQNARGGSWGPDGTIVFAPGTNSGLHRVSEAGGTPEVLTTPNIDQGTTSHRWPSFLPGGEAVLFSAGTSGGFQLGSVMVLNLETGEQQTVVQGGSYAHYVRTGHVLFGRSGVLEAISFDLNRLETTGPAFPVIQDFMTLPGAGAAQFSLAEDGTLVYLPSTNLSDSSLVWVDRQGGTQLVTQAQHGYRSPRISPDGQRLAVRISDADDIDPNAVIWIYEIAEDIFSRLSFDIRSVVPVWTPDGKRVTFGAGSGLEAGLYWKAADGSSAAEQLLESEFPRPSSWSPDGKVLAYTNTDNANADIMLLRLASENTSEPFLATSFWEGGPVFSPDGSWLAYVSDESGMNEIYVLPYPGPGSKRLISTEGGTEPVWSRDGTELFYRSENKMMAVAIETEPDFRAARPQVLFEGEYQTWIASRPNYDVTSDGQRFIMVKSTSISNQLHVVLNWFEELKTLVPTN